MLCPFRSRISNPGSLSSNFLRIHARRPLNSDVSLLRGYATRRPPSPPRSRVLPSQTPARPPPPPPPANSAASKIETAQRLFKAGDKILYKSTRRTTFFRVQSWIIVLFAGAGTAAAWSSGFLDVKTFRDMNHDYPQLLFITYSVVCVFLGAIIAFAVLRARNHIDRIDLVEQSGKTLIQVTSRSGIPFMKTRFVVQPSDFTVDNPFVAATYLPESLIPVAPSESSPSAFTAGVIRETVKSISRALYSIFDGFRAYLLRQGWFEVDVKRPDKKAKQYTMDAAGDYLIMKDKVVLWDVVETKDPYGYY